MALPTTAAGVVSRRLATQRLTGPALPTAADAVRLLTCVQSQERDHASFSLGERSRARTLAAVEAEHSRGDLLRTHILRPTWHFVVPEDLRWILALTSPRVERSLAARHRQLDLDDDRRLGRALDRLATALADRAFATRKEVGDRIADAGIAPGEQLGHLLLVAELRGLICSGPLDGRHHTYALVDEVVAPAPVLDPEEARVRLVHRFFAGHGPASVRDFARWSSLTMGDTRRALAQLTDTLEAVEVEGLELWFDPSVPARRRPRAPTGFLLPTYDEVTLTYPQLGFPSAPEHPYDEHPDPFWAFVVVDGVNVGLWKRTVRKGAVGVEVRLSPAVDAGVRAEVEVAARRLAAFHRLDLDLTVAEGRPHLWGGSKGHPARRPRR